MNTLRFTTNSTPDGEFHIIIDDRDVARAAGFGDVETLRGRLPGAFSAIALESAAGHPYQRSVDAYYEGDGAAFDAVAREQNGTDFQQRVWKAMSAIPYGTTMSYKELAQVAGIPAAIRAVGTVCRLNRLVLLVPCHRVIKSDGTTGNYRYGTQVKESLLRRERAMSPV